MGIRFLCPACEKKIHVKDHQAGLRGFCPKCGARVEIPLHSTLLPKKRKGTDLEKVLRPGVPPGAVGEQTLMSLLPPVGRLLGAAATPPTDPLGEFPHYQWYVVPQGGAEPFGPADARLIGQWMHEGRIAARSMVWRQDWPAWRKAGNVWSQLILAEPEPSVRPERRFSERSPHFDSPDVPKSSPLLPQLPPRAAASPAVAAATASPRPPASRGISAPPRFEAPQDELYYPRRSHGAYLAWVVLLAAAVVALGFVMLRVIDRLRHPQPAPAAQPTEPDPPEKFGPENRDDSETTAARGRSIPTVGRS